MCPDKFEVRGFLMVAPELPRLVGMLYLLKCANPPGGMFKLVFRVEQRSGVGLFETAFPFLLLGLRS